MKQARAKNNKPTRRPAHFPRISVLTSALVLIAGTALSCGSWWISLQIERSRLEHEIEDHLRNHLVSIEAGLRSNVFVLDALAAYFESDEDVSRSEFRTFSASLLGAHTDIEALAWVPRISRDELTERDTPGRQEETAEHSDRFPVFYVEPATGSMLAATKDLRSDNTYRAALDQARDTGRPTATGRIDLPPDAGRQYGFAMIQPIYRGGTTPATLEERRRDLAGFVAATFRIGDIVQQAMAPLHSLEQNRHMEVRIFDPGASAGQRLLYPRGGSAVDPDGLHRDIKSERTVNIAGRSWLLVAIPSAAYEHARTTVPWLVLAAGLLITVLLAAFVTIILQRASDRRAALRSLEESETLLRSFLENSPNATILKDVDGRYLMANAAFFREAGTDDLVGKASIDLFADDPERCRLVAEHEREVVQRRVPIVKEREWRGTNNGPETHIITKFPILNEAGEVIQIGSIATDITAWKRAERELQDLNRAYRTLSRCNEVLVRSESEESLVANVCRTIVEIGGYAGAAVDVTEGGRSDVIRPVAKFGKVPEKDIHRPSWDGPTSLTAAAGSRRTTQLASHGPEAMVALPLLSGERTIGVLTVFGNGRGVLCGQAVALLEELAGDMAFGIMALRTKAEHDIAEREMRKLARAVEQSPAMIMVTDAEGSIEYVNPRFTEITGYAPEEAIGAKPSLLKSGEVPAQVYEALWQTVNSGGEWRGLLHNKRKDGTLFWGETAISPVFDADGKITHFIGIQEDVTEKLEKERRLRHADKMDSLGNLAGGIAHDFNNMLLPICTLTEMVLKDMEPGSKARHRLERVLEATQRAHSLAQRILAFGRSGDGEARTAGISEVTVDTVNLLKSTLPKSIALDVRIEPGLRDVNCDRGQIETIILNLAKNAADAMGRKPGDLRISLERTDLAVPLAGLTSTIAAGRYACLTIADTGTGIEPDNLAKIFQPYFTTKARGEGTGLGLAMVRTIILKHGGEITVDSQVGLGTTFRIYLPLHDVERSPATANAAPTTAA